MADWRGIQGALPISMVENIFRGKENSRISLVGVAYTPHGFFILIKPWRPDFLLFLMARFLNIV